MRPAFSRRFGLAGGAWLRYQFGNCLALIHFIAP
jgi:hypothetical protein